ncbi:hypothetical protein ACIQI8_28620 [Streptomyces sp. NPDC092369]|uniref:hypothetical protein n=1 Tax=Streptomyces sp. NPDC092369 TaxID=3366015 RepID=UPI003804A394
MTQLHVFSESFSSPATRMGRLHRPRLEELTAVIPPVYGEWIGRAFLADVAMSEAAA